MLTDRVSTDLHRPCRHLGSEAKGGYMYRIKELQESGLTDRELRALRKQKERVTTGIYRDHDLDPWARYRLECVALVSRLGPSAALAGPSAALFWDLPKTNDPPDKVYVTGVTRGRYNDDLQVLGEFETVEHEGMLLSTAAATVASCATLLSSRDALIVADAVLADELCTAEELIEQAAEMRGRKRADRARWIAEHADGRSESPGETWARLVVTQLGYEVIPQFPVHHDNREARLDLLIEGTKTAIEFDGLIKYRKNKEAQVVYEHLREGDLQELGYALVKLIWMQLPGHQQIDKRLRATGARPVRRPRFLKW